jgi:hypothetical protein
VSEVKGNEIDGIAGARKDDRGKAPIYRGVLCYFPRAVASVATVSAFGATKYAWNGWLHVPDGFNRYSDGLVRHLGLEGQGQVYDDESGLRHASHAAWNALARLELQLIESEQSEPNS